MLRVSGSTSTSMGRAPTCSITLTPEQNVIGVVRTASPGPIPRLTSARCSAAVQELNARAAGASTAAANSSSKRFTLGPVVIQSERSVSTTSAISSSLIQGGEKGRYSFRILGVLKFPMKRMAAPPKIGRPLQKQLPAKPIDFVEAARFLGGQPFV